MISKEFVVPGALFIEKRRGGFLAWKPNTSRFFLEEAALLKFVKWPKGTPTGDLLREWLAPTLPTENDVSK